MKQCFSLFLLLTVVVSCGFAQSFSPIKDEAATRKKLMDASQSTTAIKSDFVQEKNLSMIAEKVISKGVFYFKKDGKIRLEYRSPFKYLMVISDGKVLIKDDQKSTQIDIHKNRMFQQVNNIIINCVKGDVFTSGDFKVSLFENATQVKVEMTPLAKGMKEFFQSIFIFIDKKDYSANRIEMNELSGDNTIISFTNKELNGKIDDSLFGVK